MIPVSRLIKAQSWVGRFKMPQEDTIAYTDMVKIQESLDFLLRRLVVIATDLAGLGRGIGAGAATCSTPRKLHAGTFSFRAANSKVEAGILFEPVSYR